MSVNLAVIPSNSVINNFHPAIASIGSDNKVDVGAFALKIMTSMALIVTNSILTVTVSAMKLTGFTIVTSLTLGYLTKPLHACNKILTKQAFAPFKEWSEMLGNENKRILETDKVISVENRKIYFDKENYKKYAIDSFKAVVAPVSLALSLANAALWLAVKPLWVALLPGMLGDILVTGPIALNKAIGHWTYTPLKGISDWMLEKHDSYLDKALPKRGF